MKRIFLVLALVAVLVVSLVLGGCSSAYTKKQTDEAIDAAVGYVLDQMPDAATGPAGAAGPAGPAGPATTVEDLDFYDLTDDQIEDLRDILGIEEWEEEEWDEDNDNGDNSTSGEVTVSIAMDEDFYWFETTDYSCNLRYRMPVEIVNDTDEWQEVSFDVLIEHAEGYRNYVGLWRDITDPNCFSATVDSVDMNVNPNSPTECKRIFLNWTSVHTVGVRSGYTETVYLTLQYDEDCGGVWDGFGFLTDDKAYWEISVYSIYTD